ncbi:unnamed protein product [Paramecium sonneborni]|uniref:Uncharacterized protein n=1 Tax=Paramecium sonneborni TaxID=65129 RepID=A0A8S1R295_9CILI|nr:unnamed protein product [Paramecium sonneborni]
MISLVGIWDQQKKFSTDLINKQVIVKKKLYCANYLNIQNAIYSLLSSNLSIVNFLNDC